MKLSKKQCTKAFARFARRYNLFVQLVRTCTDLKQRAIAEYKAEVM